MLTCITHVTKLRIRTGEPGPPPDPLGSQASSAPFRGVPHGTRKGPAACRASAYSTACYDLGHHSGSTAGAPAAILSPTRPVLWQEPVRPALAVQPPPLSPRMLSCQIAIPAAGVRAAMAVNAARRLAWIKASRARRRNSVPYSIVSIERLCGWAWRRARQAGPHGVASLTAMPAAPRTSLTQNSLLRSPRFSRAA